MGRKEKTKGEESKKKGRGKKKEEEGRERNKHTDFYIVFKNIKTKKLIFRRRRGSR